jgi:hypothetical protein
LLISVESCDVSCGKKVKPHGDVIHSKGKKHRAGFRKKAVPARVNVKVFLRRIDQQVPAEGFVELPDRNILVGDIGGGEMAYFRVRGVALYATPIEVGKEW